MRFNLRLFDMETVDELQYEAYKSPVNKEFVKKLEDTLRKYSKGRQVLSNKIIENERWYRSRHWDIIRGKAKNENDPEPVTGFLFNAIANKHADMMDYFPTPNILEREESDQQEAEKLTKIVPLVLEKNDYRETYSNAMWYKLKQGCVPYGVFWNPQIENGLGDIDIQKLDLLNVYWQPGITDIQKSPYLFVLNLIDNEMLHQMYPKTKDLISSSNDKAELIKSYFNDDTIDYSEKSVIVDCYYKKIDESGKQILHLTKYVDDMPLASTEDNEEVSQTGLYDHGQYPIIFDTLFPEEGTPVGFGYVDLIKNPQMYVDKLDQIISKNALVAGKIRTIIKDTGNINEEELADLSKDIIHSHGTVREGEDFATIQGKSLPGFIVNHRTNKIEELKEISGNRDFSQGGTAGGVTAYSAIVALQEAGNKLSRDMIGESYGAYRKLIYMVIELIRQFYDEERTFRITNDMGDKSYVPYNNENLKKQQIPPEYEGAGLIEHPETGEVYPSLPSETGELVPDDSYQPKYRLSIFDIKVQPEKSSPFSQAAQNEMAKEMFNMGFFNPQRAVEAKTALEMMMFEGKDKILKIIAQNGDLFAQLQQMQQQIAMLQQSDAEKTQIIAGMNHVIKQKTGKDMFQANPSNIQQMPEGGQM